MEYLAVLLAAIHKKVSTIQIRNKRCDVYRGPKNGYYYINTKGHITYLNDMTNQLVALNKLSSGQLKELVDEFFKADKSTQEQILQEAANNYIKFGKNKPDTQWFDKLDKKSRDKLTDLAKLDARRLKKMGINLNGPNQPNKPSNPNKPSGPNQPDSGSNGPNQPNDPNKDIDKDNDINNDTDNDNNSSIWRKLLLIAGFILASIDKVTGTGVLTHDELFEWFDGEEKREKEYDEEQRLKKTMTPEEWKKHEYLKKQREKQEQTRERKLASNKHKNRGYSDRVRRNRQNQMSRRGMNGR